MNFWKKFDFLKKRREIFSQIHSLWRKTPGKPVIILGAILGLIIVSNLFLQMAQNEWDLPLALDFAFSWHMEKFFLGCLVLLILWGFISSLLGSLAFGSLFYSLLILGIGIADFFKMKYRMEPLYPDDLKMIEEISTLKDIAGWPLFTAFIFLLLSGVAIILFSLYRSFKKTKKVQVLRILGLVITTSALFYVSNFNDSSNLLRKAYNRTALWIPYSQEMNYYNTGFMGGFLYNLKVEAMEKPAGYSKAAVEKIVKKYNQEKTTSTDEEPNIIYVMSESFSDTSKLNGITIEGGNPLADYKAVAENTYSGQMLSQNYGGGTANIEFEALTGFSMALFNSQLTTPYTMLVPNFDEFPSLVSTLEDQGYNTTAIHPYNTSMYKRQSVYETFGFNTFIDKDSIAYTDKIGDNPYISDKAAYKEILALLEDDQQAQFVHLVTMQTHMPYSDKYVDSQYTAEGNNTVAVDNYLQDIAYSSKALKNFLKKVDQLERRTLVVFWGDHLPGIYSDEIQGKNSGTTLHETEFLMYDNHHEISTEQDIITSPFYFAADLFQQANLSTTGFQQLLLKLQKILPAFEKQMYYQNGKWKKELSLTKKQKKIYREYQMIQYDIVAGKQYSLDAGFFKE